MTDLMRTELVPSVAVETRSTELPCLPQGQVPPPRRLDRVSRNDVLSALGAALSGWSVTALIFGTLTPMRGTLGFLVVWFVVFLAVYALLISIEDDRPAVIDRVMAALLTAGALLAGCALASVIVYVFARGWRAFFNLNLYVDDMSEAGPLDGLDVGGIAHAIVGSLVIMGLALVFTVPIGVICAVYLNETRGRLTEFVRTVVTAMTALPSIIAGLFIFSTWILVLGFERSGLAASIAVSIMMLPIIVRSGDVVLRLVPGSLREASAALGAPRWRTVWHVVLPTARSGLTTSVILGMARGIGETAPILLTSGFTQAINVDPTQNAMMSLPFAAFEFIRSPQPAYIQRGFASASVLLLLVLILFAVARILGGRSAGHLSGRQRRRADARSRRDQQRIADRHVRPGSTEELSQQ